MDAGLKLYKCYTNVLMFQSLVFAAVGGGGVFTCKC